jgi:hephaestin
MQEHTEMLIECAPSEQLPPALPPSQTLQPKPASEAHTGLLGPVLRAAVGQVVTLVLRNNLNFSVNLEPAGVQAVQPGADAAAALSPAAAPGETVTYRWIIPADMGPSPQEPSAKLWLYRSTVDLVRDANAGLLGPMLIRC